MPQERNALQDLCNTTIAAIRHDHLDHHDDDDDDDDDKKFEILDCPSTDTESPPASSESSVSSSSECTTTTVLPTPQRSAPRQHQQIQLRYYTASEISSHNSFGLSAWIVAGTKVYDVTDYFDEHPGGTQSLMGRLGGSVDCTRDFWFHSRKGQKDWERFRIGTVTEQASQNGRPVCEGYCGIRHHYCYDWWRLLFGE